MRRSDNARRELERAVALRRAGRFDEARGTLQPLLEAFPLDPVVRYQAAWLCDVEGRETEAIAHYERALELGLDGEDRRGALIGLGSTYRVTGQAEKAVALLEPVVRAHPDWSDARVFLALARYNAGDAKGSIEELLRLLIETTGDPAIRRYEKALELYAEDLERTWD